MFRFATLENAVAIAELAICAIEDPPTAMFQIVNPCVFEDLDQFDPIGADILDRGGTNSPGNPGQIFQPLKAHCERPVDELMPGFTSSNFDQHLIRVVSTQTPTAPQGHVNHGFGKIASQQQVTAAAQDEGAAAIQPGEYAGQLILALEIEQFEGSGCDAEAVQAA